MVFPFVIFAQYFSRGVLFVSCLAQEQWMVLVGGLAVSSVIGSPVQGWMSDRGSRKNVLLVTVLCVIASIVLVLIRERIGDERVFLSLLGLAVVLNGIFGNVFPVASAAHSEKYDLSVPETLRHVQPAKILGLGFPLLTLALSALYRCFGDKFGLFDGCAYGLQEKGSRMKRISRKMFYRRSVNCMLCIRLNKALFPSR